MEAPIKNYGLRVVLAATGINLALGVLYSWSLFKDAIRQDIESGSINGFVWDLSSLNDPYALCLLVFAFMMIPAGLSQDRFGPRISASIGGILVGVGFLWLAQTQSYIEWLLAFGVLVGSGIAFGYASATPAAMRWYPPHKTGLIAGIVVSGFGLASVYIAPLASWMMTSYGLTTTMTTLGIAFFILVTGLSLLLKSPPPGFKPAGFIERRSTDSDNHQIRTQFTPIESSPTEMLKSSQFWLVWSLYFIGAGAGLMVIGSVAGMAKASLGEAVFVAVALLAIGNAGGRVVAGILSDKIGRSKTLLIMLSFQALLMFASIPLFDADAPGAILVVVMAILIGFNYGTNLAIFPAISKDLWGISHFGINYGLLFTAWGVGGFMMSKTSQFLMINSGSYSASFMTAGVLLVIGALLSFKVKDPRA